LAHDALGGGVEEEGCRRCYAHAKAGVMLIKSIMFVDKKLL
jgi:hypothetical protein